MMAQQAAVDKAAALRHHVPKYVRIGEKMTTLTATAARREFFDVVKGATDQHQIYRIHHRRGAVVLLAETDYDSLLETLDLLSLPGFRKSLKRSVNQMRKGDTLSLEEVFGNKA